MPIPVLDPWGHATPYDPIVERTGAAVLTDFAVDPDNCAAALQRCIDYAAASTPKREVFIPRGTYTLIPARTDARFYDGGSGDYLFAVNVPSGITIRGEGRSSTFYLPGGGDHADGPYGPGATAPFYYPIVLEGDDICVKNLRFVGDNGDADGTGFNLVSTWKAISMIGGTGPAALRDISILGVYFENLFGTAIQAGPMAFAYERVKIANNYFRWCNGINPTGDSMEFCNNDVYSASQLEIIGNQAVVSDNKFSGSRCHGIAVQDGDNTIISNNQIDMSLLTTGTYTDGIPGGILCRGTRGAVISGNTIRGAPAASITLEYEPAGDRYPICNSIVGNTIINERTASIFGHLAGIGIQLSEDDQTTLEGNSIVGLDGLDFRLQYGILASSSTRLTIIGGGIRGGINGLVMEGVGVADVTAQALSIHGLTGTGVIVSNGCNFVALVGIMTRTATGGNVDILVEPGATNIRIHACTANIVSLEAQAIKSEVGNSWQD